MSAVDRILQQERERKQREEERRKREDAAFSAVMALCDNERHAVVARLIEAIEASGTPLLQGESSGSSYVDRAEAFVAAHPQGVKTRDVAEAIGQDMASTDGTLRQLIKRETVERRDSLWFPKGNQTATAAKKTINELILEVYASDKGPFSTSELFKRVQKLQPNVNRGSFNGEVNRLKHHCNPKVLISVGTSPQGGGLYALAEAEAAKR